MVSWFVSNYFLSKKKENLVAFVSHTNLVLFSFDLLARQNKQTATGHVIDIFIAFIIFESSLHFHIIICHQKIHIIKGENRQMY